ncbi:hypothetical protein NQ315_014644 [Exocentrus adspersus]|uniref:DNA-directed DNA polymerase n=1 Tax=Exocentrus adspersus TaxID=1586481 RepID=A0AAV8VR38_9CUCU|nr:hypothetical protein NQ315_014644 [Exocentrus adspersus]
MYTASLIIYQPNSRELNTETFCLVVTSVKMLAGRGRDCNYNTHDEECSKRREIVCIKKTKTIYAIRDPQLVKMRKDVGKMQTQGLIADGGDWHRFEGRAAASLRLSTVCQQTKRFEECLKTVKFNRKHVCGEVHCKVCRKHASADYLCNIQSDTGKPKSEDLLFVFYDLETRQENVEQDGAHLHEPNLCVFKQWCNNSLNSMSGMICAKCGVVVVAHNDGGFDGQFVLNYVFIKTDLNPELIIRGTKITMIESKLPKAFGLGDNYKKWYFPHLFNTIANANYIGPLRPIEYYSPNTLKMTDRSSSKYCISDVEILTVGCMKFRQQMLETGGVCPFTEACPITSCYNKVFRHNFLQPNTIGIIPKRGCRWRCNQSKIANQKSNG